MWVFVFLQLIKMKNLVEKISNWEAWPFKLIYFPITPVWFFYMLKARSVWFFSNVNPTIEFAGFEGETKKEMYDQLPKDLYPKTIYIEPYEAFDIVEIKIKKSDIQYPFVVKPNIGMHALLFRKIENKEALKEYHTKVDVEYVLQDLIEYPMEFSVFHIRYPGETKGIITGFIQKEYLQIVGDGMDTIEELILKHPKAKLRLNEIFAKHSAVLNNVLEKEEIYYLSIAGNHNRGARFLNLEHEIDEQLENVFNKISNDSKHFYYGRYDFKCTSLEDLKKGKNISILEFNGVGAEPNHIYDCEMNYFRAMSTILKHWKMMYEISEINRKAGIERWSFKRGNKLLNFSKIFFKKLQLLETQIP